MFNVVIKPTVTYTPTSFLLLVRKTLHSLSMKESTEILCLAFAPNFAQIPPTYIPLKRHNATSRTWSSATLFCRVRFEQHHTCTGFQIQIPSGQAVEATFLSQCSHCSSACLHQTHIFLPGFASSLFSFHTHSCSFLNRLPRLLRQGSPLDRGLQRSAGAVLLIPPQEWITKWKWPRGLPGPPRSARSCSPPSPALFPKVLNPRCCSRDPHTELACLWLLQICQLWVN